MFDSTQGPARFRWRVFREIENRFAVLPMYAPGPEDLLFFFLSHSFKLLRCSGNQAPRLILDYSVSCEDVVPLIRYQQRVWPFI